MLFSKIKDYKLRKKLKSIELKQTVKKFVAIHHFFLTKKKVKSCYLPFSKNNTKTKLVRRCVLTNRSRGSIRPFHISRLKLRELIQFGLLPGYKKSVW